VVSHVPERCASGETDSVLFKGSGYWSTVCHDYLSGLGYDNVRSPTSTYSVFVLVMFEALGVALKLIFHRDNLLTTHLSIGSIHRLRYSSIDWGSTATRD